eukprot:17965-Eustigmatos_ZCMA.PRE.1
MEDTHKHYGPATHPRPSRLSESQTIHWPPQARRSLLSQGRGWPPSRPSVVCVATPNAARTPSLLLFSADTEAILT